MKIVSPHRGGILNAKFCESKLLKSRITRYQEKVLENGLNFKNGSWHYKPSHNQLLSSVPNYKESCLNFQKNLETKLSRNKPLQLEVNNMISKKINEGLYRKYSDVLKQYPHLQENPK